MPKRHPDYPTAKAHLVAIFKKANNGRYESQDDLKESFMRWVKEWSTLKSDEQIETDLSISLKLGMKLQGKSNQSIPTEYKVKIEPIASQPVISAVDRLCHPTVLEGIFNTGEFSVQGT